MSTRKSETVAKALRIIDMFLENGAGHSLAQLSAKTGINKSTILRLCATLEEAGLLQRDRSMAYVLGHKIWQLALVYQRQFRLEEMVRPLLRRLRDETKESASFYVRNGGVRVCLFRENSRHRICHHVEEGTQFPLRQGVVGRVLLAYSGEPGREHDAIRRDGYFMAQGREPLTSSVAVPVLTRDGKLVGAIVVSGPSSRFTEQAQRNALTKLISCSTAIAERLPAELPATSGSSSVFLP
jgi:DNA-binding IclR family transcriptional regulator